MPDAMLEEIWRARDKLIKRHGGFDGYFEYVQKLDRAHRQRGRGRKRTGSRHVQRKPTRSC